MVYSEYQPGSNYQVINGDVLPLDEPLGRFEDEAPIFDHIQGSPELERQEQTPEGDTMSRAERQMTLHERFHFYADTKDELTLATRLTASDDLIAGAATQLSRIQLHQEYKTSSKDPSAAARKITNEMAEYATQPLKDISFLRFIDQYIVDAGVDGKAKIDTISAITTWKDEPSVRRAIIDLLRYQDTYDLIYNDGEDHIGDSFASRDKEANARIETFVSSLTASRAQELIKIRIAEHKTKSDFWSGHLETVEKHYLGPVRAIAARALSTLQVKNPRSR